LRKSGIVRVVMAERTAAPGGVPSPSSDDEWLIVVDMQRAFAAADSVWHVERFWEIAARIERLLAAYGSRTILTRYVPPASLTGAWRDYFAAFPSMELPADDPTWDIVIGVQAQAHIETRTTFAKWDANIATIIGPDAPVTVCGVATECCVLATALAAIDDGRSVRVVEDACAGATPQLHEHAMALLAAFAPLVCVVRCEEVIRQVVG